MDAQTPAAGPAVRPVDRTQLLPPPHPPLPPHAGGPRRTALRARLRSRPDRVHPDGVLQPEDGRGQGSRCPQRRVREPLAHVQARGVLGHGALLPARGPPPDPRRDGSVPPAGRRLRHLGPGPEALRRPGARRAEVHHPQRGRYGLFRARPARLGTRVARVHRDDGLRPQPRRHALLPG